jgi:AraC-like DNA-binding protein
MNIDLNMLIAILMLFVLTFFSILLFHVGRHTKSNIYLVIYFISQIVGIAYLTFEKGSDLSLLSGAVKSIVCMWGPLFYLFITSSIFPYFKFSLKTLLHFVPGFLVFIYILLTQKLRFLQSSWIFVFVFNMLIVIYNVAAFYNYSVYRKQKNNLSTNKLVPEEWVKVALFGFAISCFIVQVCNHFGEYFGLTFTLRNLIGNLAFLIFFCVLFYVAIINRLLIHQSEITDKYKSSPLSDTDAHKLLERLEQHMIINKPFIDQDLSLKGLAISLHISERHLSQIINKYKNQNFSEYINYHRVQYAMELLKRPVNIKKTMFSILLESGFNSKTSFNTSFRKIANCTPIEFKKKMLSMTFSDNHLKIKLKAEYSQTAE